MFFCSIYKRLKNDFQFLEQYGYKFKREAKHYVEPAIEFCKNEESLLIGYAYDLNSFFISYFDENIREYPDENNLKKIEEVDPYRAVLFSQGWPKPFYVVGENTYLEGKSYKAQLQQVKQLLENYLVKKN